MKLRWFFLSIAFLPVACGKKSADANSAEDARQIRETKIALEECDTKAEGNESVDADGDGNPEVVRVLKEEREVCRTVDLNFDGKIDRTTFFDEAGKVRKIESDFDKDGVVDEIALFDAGVLKEKQRATTLDGKLDTWDFYDKGQVARTERDENGDGVIDQWWEYPSRGCPLIHVDTDGDGRPDPGASIDYCKETGYTPPPLPEDESATSADFGSQDARVEELSNESTDEAGQQSAADEPAEEEGAAQ